MLSEKNRPMTRIIELVPYNPDWLARFDEESHRIRQSLAGNVFSIDHIGSTAIPGMIAKPTIDMLLVVTNLSVLESSYAVMQSLGYQPKGEHGVPGRRYFVKFSGERHLFHLHAFQNGHPEIDRHLNFRDYLRAHHDQAHAYQALKRRLAERYREEPAKYTAGKADFIQGIDRLAAAWRVAADEHTRL